MAELAINLTARLGLWAAIVAVALAAIPGAARADGDPASDVLLSQSSYVPADAGAPAAQQRELAALLRAAQRSGLPIRVALIPSRYDLGSVGVLWRKPRTYAQFLGIELSSVFNHPVLVAMPDGLGVYWSGHSTAAIDRVLARVSTRPGAGLLVAAETGVRQLAAAGGVKLAPPQVPAAPSAGGDGPLWIAIGSLVLILGLAALVLWRRPQPRRPQARRQQPRFPGRPALRVHFPLAGRLRWAVPGVAVLCGVAVGAPILIVTSLRHTPDPGALPAERAPFTWQSGERRAPNFRLTDQSGRPVSIAADRGRPVIVTFVDPLCRNLCPLAAHVLNEVASELPPAQRPAIIAVSVDVYADSHADLEQDFGRWHLVPEWRWAVGKAAQLASVWSRYKVGVSVANKRIAGSTIHIITHDELAYVVDPRGYERALFVWPYWPQDVIRTLRLVSSS